MTTDVSSIPEVISPQLIDHGIEVGAKLVTIDAHVCCGQRRDVRPGDEGAPTGTPRSKLGDGFTVPRDDERFTAGHRVHHFRVLVAQLTLCNRFRHILSVAIGATFCYAAPKGNATPILTLPVWPSLCGNGRACPGDPPAEQPTGFAPTLPDSWPPLPR